MNVYIESNRWYSIEMNIFVLSYDPTQAARMLCDKHVRKMGIEAAQMLSTALWLCDYPGVVYDASDWKDDWWSYARADCIRAYKPTHIHHPCTRWAMATINYNWLMAHAAAIFEEYTLRFGTRHQSANVVDQLPKFSSMDGPIRFVQAIPDEFKDPDPVKAYRKYYVSKPIKMTWTNREFPEWLNHLRRTTVA